jgi:hypothetical protein
MRPNPSWGKRLAALLRLAHVTAHADADRLAPARRPSAPPAADLVCVFTYVRRRLTRQLRGLTAPGRTASR